MGRCEILSLMADFDSDLDFSSLLLLTLAFWVLCKYSSFFQIGKKAIRVFSRQVMQVFLEQHQAILFLCAFFPAVLFNIGPRLFADLRLLRH